MHFLKNLQKQQQTRPGMNPDQLVSSNSSPAIASPVASNGPGKYLYTQAFGSTPTSSLFRYAFCFFSSATERFKVPNFGL
jgi:hypothetical protein